jgi:hypothetical protein
VALPALPLGLAAALAISLAYWYGPALDIDIGSGREEGVARGLGPYENEAGATCRAALRDAQLDLRDFGAGRWTVALTTLSAGEEHWTTRTFDVQAPFGWRSGLALALAERGDSGVRIDRVTIARAHALPSLRLLASAWGAALLLGAILATAGLSRRSAVLAAAVVLAAEAAALAADPLTVVPYFPTFLAIAALGVLLTGFVTGGAAIAEQRGAARLLPPGAIAAASAGFVAWLAATTAPLYRGGNFTFHSNIAEEIWKGRLLLYYLPFPGSMLSRQAQWGDIIVPHPCFEQIAMSPLAALPQPWFHFAEKLVLALLLASMDLLAGAVATRNGGQRAGVFAGVITACLVPTFLLLGLGHLMTLFGCWASSLALGYLIFRIGELGERRVFWTAVALLTLAYLSYFASLLFTGLALACALALLAMRDPIAARRLAGAALWAALGAFLIYYMYWAWPFLSQSLPKIVGGASAARGTPVDPTPVWHRLVQEPRKLDYSYGSLLVPLVGLLGLVRVRSASDRVLLFAWAAVLPIVCVLDVKFNFILKHHYFVMVPVAVGVGLALAALSERGRAGRVTAVVLLAALALLAAETSLAVAIGEIP